MKRQIEYNNSAFAMRFELPAEWDVANISAVNISIDNLDGGSLLASTATTLFSAIALSSAAAIGDTTVNVDFGSAVSAGDRLRINPSTLGPSEDIEVLFSDANTSGTFVTTEPLKYAHKASTPIYGLFCTYDLDTSTVATWEKGLQVVITLTPVGSDDVPIKERGEVASFMFSFPDFDHRFKVLYPREYKIREKILRDIYEEAFIQVQLDVSSIGFDVHRLVDSDFMRVAILKKARWIVCEGGGDKWESERTVAMDEYQRQIEIIKNQPVYIDDNQDGVMDDVEIDDHMQFLGLERGH